MITAENIAQITGVRHGFFTRRSGHSSGLYTSLNCGFGSGDDRASVAANRAVAARRLGVEPAHLLTVFQYHSGEAAVIDAIHQPEDAPRADGMVCATKGIAIGILTADCTPVLFADRKGRCVGACHAGWQGAFAGVAENTVAAMARLGAEPAAIDAAIGPVISQQNYEVGPEFFERFIARDAATAGLFIPSAKAGHYMFDLPGFVHRRLETLGLASITGSDGCTYGDEDRFFSYRRATHRNEPDYGRQISAIALV